MSAGSATRRWKEAARLFFAERASSVPGAPSLEDLCFVSGRDPRVWRDPALYAEMIDSIVEQAALGPGHRVLEVGCASGFLARGLAPRCREYVGVDIAADTLQVARRLGLENASFRAEDASRLSFEDASFDRALSYDVFTNFPDMDVARAVVREMWRVVRPGGRVLVGSLPDREKAEEAAARAAALGEELERRFGPAPVASAPGADGVLSRWLRRLRRVEPGIVCYDFTRADFERLGEALGAETRILEIHAGNPYRGCRFNAVFVKPAKP